MKHDGLIFDLDGTLWDCSEACSAAFNAAFESCGVSKSVSPDFVRSIAGKPCTECDELLLEGVPEELRARVQKELDTFEINFIKSRAANSLYPNVRKYIELLAQHYKLYLVSNCGAQYLRVFLDSAGIGQFFSDAECYGRTGLPKSSNIVSIVERNGLIAACYIGDTVSDETAAREARVDFYHAAYGFGHVGKAKGAFKTFAQLSDYFISNYFTARADERLPETY
jgi:phosphoglycolate phosphatase